MDSLFGGSWLRSAAVWCARAVAVYGDDDADISCRYVRNEGTERASFLLDDATDDVVGDVGVVVVVSVRPIQADTKIDR